jgi:hypothetical protein
LRCGKLLLLLVVRVVLELFLEDEQLGIEVFVVDIEVDHVGEDSFADRCSSVNSMSSSRVFFCITEDRRSSPSMVACAATLSASSLNIRPSRRRRRS